MTRQPRFEIVRTDAGWLGRFIAANGREIWRTSEVYTTKRRATDALRILVNPLDARVTRIGIRSIPDKVPPIDVRDVDERGKSKRSRLFIDGKDVSYYRNVDADAPNYPLADDATFDGNPE